MTEREAAIIKAARDAQRREDAATLEFSAKVLEGKGFRKTAAALFTAAAAIRAGTS